MNPNPHRRDLDPGHEAGIALTTVNGQIILIDPATEATLAVLPAHQAIGLASGLAAAVSGTITDTAPELDDELWHLAGRLHRTLTAWQPDLCPDPRYWHLDPHADKPWPYVPEDVTARCDNHSVGVIITDPQGRYLLIQRVRPPVGIAPVAGHIDDHGSARDAAIAEVAEEVGLTVTRLTWLTGRWRSNICRRQHGPHGPGHDWTIYHAETTGTVRTDPAETTNPRWYTRDQLRHLADRTAAYAHGTLSADQYAANPGLEPVWVEFLAETGHLPVIPEDLTAINRLASRSPYPQPGGATR